MEGKISYKFNFHLIVMLFFATLVSIVQSESNFRRVSGLHAPTISAAPQTHGARHGAGEDNVGLKMGMFLNEV